MTDSVSFVAPARNEAGYVGEALDAIRATGDHELVVDGNSDDATPDIAREHGWEVSVTESAAGGARFEFSGVERAGE